MIDSLPAPKHAVINFVQNMPDTVTFERILSGLNEMQREYERKKIALEYQEVTRLFDGDNFLLDKKAGTIIWNYLSYKETNKLPLTKAQKVYIAYNIAEGQVGNGGFTMLLQSMKTQGLPLIDEGLAEFDSASSGIFRKVLKIFNEFPEYFEGDYYVRDHTRKDGADPKEELTAELDRRLAELEPLWYDLAEEREAKVYEYLRKNRQDFEFDKMSQYFKGLMQRPEDTERKSR